MKKTFIIELVLTKSNTQFEHGLGPGVILQAEIEYTLTEEQAKSPSFVNALLQKGLELRREHVEIKFRDKESEGPAISGG